MSLDKLFSIDLDEKISKVTKNRFIEDYFYIVELIKTALLRGANRVDVGVKGKLLVIRDNGRGISRGQISKLEGLFNKRLDIKQREVIIEEFIQTTGLGLLSLFSPDYRRILINNIRKNREDKVIFENSACQYKNQKGKYTPQTEIRISLRKEVRINPIRKIITKYCSHIGPSIYINQRILTYRSLLSDCFIKLKLTDKTDQINGELGIPIRDNICKFQLLHGGIPWTIKVFEPQSGLIFRLVAESDQESFQRISDLAAPVTYRLYRHLCDKYPDYSAVLKARTEELIFNFIKKNDDDYFLKTFKVFQLIGSDLLSFDEVFELYQNAPLYYVYQDQRMKSKMNSYLTLSLSKKQADFLINYMKLNIKHFRENGQTAHHLLLKSKYLFQDIHWFAVRLLSRKLKKVSVLDSDFERFLILLKEYLIQQQMVQFELLIHYCKGRMGSPVQVINSQDETDHQLILYLKKDHPVIRSAVEVTLWDQRYLKLLLPFIPKLKSIGKSRF